MIIIEQTYKINKKKDVYLMKFKNIRYKIVILFHDQVRYNSGNVYVYMSFFPSSITTYKDYTTWFYWEFPLKISSFVYNVFNF